MRQREPPFAVNLAKDVGERQRIRHLQAVGQHQPRDLYAREHRHLAKYVNAQVLTFHRDHVAEKAGQSTDKIHP